MIGGIRFCGCEWVPIRRFLSLFWCKTLTKSLRARFLARLEEDEGKQGPWAGNRRRQSAGGSSQRKGDCQAWSWDLWTQRLGWPAWDDESAFLVAKWEFSSKDSWQTQKHRMLGKCHKHPHFALGGNPSLCLFILLFLHSRSCICCVLCVCKEMWITPGRKWEKPQYDRMAMSGFGGWDDEGRPTGRYR